MDHFLIYFLIGTLVISIGWQIIKSSINNGFRRKTVEVLKKQKAEIQELTNITDILKADKETLHNENIKLEQSIGNQSKKFGKIDALLNVGLKKLAANLKESNSKKESLQEVHNINTYVSTLALWYNAFFGETKPIKESLELTDFIHGLSNQLTDHFSFSHLNFIHHISEPIDVNANREMIEYIFFNIGRIMGERSVSGNSIYIDTERTGKKCLITFEDAGPGIDDETLKSILIKINNQASLNDSTHPDVSSLIFIRDFIEWHDGKLWLSTIQEIGIKFTFSLPLVI